MTTTLNTELSLERVQSAVNAILDILSKPESESQKRALEAFQKNEHSIVKRLSATNLSDPYIKALGYLGIAAKLTPNTDTILAESARSAADWTREKALVRLSAEISKALD